MEVRLFALGTLLFGSEAPAFTQESTLDLAATILFLPKQMEGWLSRSGGRVAILLLTSTRLEKSGNRKPRNHGAFFVDNGMHSACQERLK